MKVERGGKRKGLYIILVSVHGLIRGQNLELGRDADTGGQTKYVVELARALAVQPDVDRVELLTRQVFDSKVSSDYANPSEPIASNAWIVRVPCGPRRYLRKEALWLHLDSFADNALRHVRSVGRLPDVIHGHYADAGYVATTLAGLLGITLVHTGHSLGRVKQQRLLEKGLEPEVIESRYHIARRIVAEEAVLSAADLVVTSTAQEVEEQYALYDHHHPERMAVLPPGTDLQRFHPPRRSEPVGPIKAQLDRFLADPRKPIVLAISRPDERKNIPTLIRAYGGNERLRDLANLVIVPGTRDDIRSMDKGAREVLTEMLMLIDYYDLYGRVAYPKQIPIEEIPEVYRIATRSHGVFINPALTEPFGLTLIEAAASGLPVVATADGGPRDILRHCNNGFLIDPLDAEAMAETLLQVLGDRRQWKRLSDQGLRGAKQHYSWQGHAAKYVKAVKKLLGRHGTNRRPVAERRRLAFMDRVLICDIDNTLTGDRGAARELVARLKQRHEQCGFGVATGRSLDKALTALKDWGMPAPDLLICSVGTEIYYGSKLKEDIGWSKLIDYRWAPDRLRELVGELPGLRPQPEEDQRRFKVSYFADPEDFEGVKGVERLLAERDLHATVVYSHEHFLDLIPERAGQGRALRYFADKWGIPIEQVVAAGDSGNDADMLVGNTLGIVVGNHAPELEELRHLRGVYFADGSHAWGVLEGLEHYDFFGACQIPVEPAEPAGA
jgi:sucrose-phosphate synthase